MPIFTVPSGDPLWEHGQKGEPNYPHAGGAAKAAKPKSLTPAASIVQPPSEIGPGTSYTRPKVIQVRTIEEALKLMHEGHAVELPDTRSVNTLLNKMAAMATDAVAKGEKAPFYDLCKVSVKNTNLFCAEKVVTKEYPDGIPRDDMPQFTGKPRPGSEAAKLPTDKDGNVDASKAFRAHLESLGLTTKDGQESAALLKATQAQLVGQTVAGMMTSSERAPSDPKYYDPAKESIFVSRDHYVIDGHHRWAAVVGRDAQDGTLGQSEMNVVRVDAPISEILVIAKAWADKYGILPKSGSKNKKAA